MRARKKHAVLRGYPIPPDRQRYVIWQNSTPHLSPHAAAVHSKVIGRYSYREYVRDLSAYLEPLLDGQHLEWCREARAIVERGGSIASEYARVARSIEPLDATFMMDKLVMDKVVDASEPLIQDPKRVELCIFKWLDTLDDSPLSQYERKLARKYLGSGATRSAAGYIAQVENYRYTREAFLKTPMPRLGAYERAIASVAASLQLPEEITTPGEPADPRLAGYLRRARTTTFGGYPFMRNMADFVSDDESDPATYADLYNHLAILFLFLPPDKKVGLAYDFIALERVQHGGAEEVAVNDDEINYSLKANKQRFVQAQSAVFSHAYKLCADAMLQRMRSQIPRVVADKFGEEDVAVQMKLITKRALASHSVSPTSTLQMGMIGADYTNFDSSQGVEMSNDVCYQFWRLMMPGSFTEYLIDPYVQAVYRESRIRTPIGYLQTTGVRSGMVDTNQTDTLNAVMCDRYELFRYMEEYPNLLSPAALDECVDSHMDNGDDRFKLSPLSASDVERFDWELGFIAQKEKQEMFPAGTPMSELGVTFLKTILCLNPDHPNRLLRTDAVSKLVLSRVRPESPAKLLLPSSFLVDCIMTCARSVDSPYLYVMVDFMYTYSDLFKDLLTGKLSCQRLAQQAALEQMTLLRLQRGDVWMRRKGMQALEVMVERFNLKWGYGDEGHRGDGGLTSDPDAGLAALPATQALLALGQQRIADGTIGSVFT